MKLEAKYTNEIKNETSIFFTNYSDITFALTNDNDQIVAIATADNLYDLDEIEDADGIEIHNLGVSAEGKGYGSMIVRSLQERFNWLEAHEILADAAGFWTKMGFEIDADAEIGVWHK